MSTTQGEQKQSIKSTIIGGAIAIAVICGAFAGVVVATDNARAQAAQLHLLSVAKSSSIVMEAATTEDAAVAASATQAQAVAYTDQKAADAQAAYDAKIAAEKAAAAKAAASKAAQQQAARQATVQQASTQQAAQTVSSPSNGAPSGTPVPMKLDTDPNSGSYGKQIIAEDPGLFCASRTASTINGVPTCD